MKIPNNGKRVKSKSGARKGRKKKGTSWPVHYSEADVAHIKQLQEKTGGALSVSVINARAIRYAIPKFLSGEVDILEVKPLPAIAPTRR